VEHDRLQAMLDSPSAYAKHEKGDATGKKTGADMIKLMPDAMIYTYAPGQPQRPNRVMHADDLPEIVLDYKPNPAWTAPNMTADALTGIEGRLWIDAKTHYLIRIEGTVFRPINFGLFLAHVYPGGKLTFEQTKASEQRWIFTRFTENVELRVLVKTLKEDTDIGAEDFSTVPEMSYQDAIKMLWATRCPQSRGWDVSLGAEFDLTPALFEFVRRRCLEGVDAGCRFHRVESCSEFLVGFAECEFGLEF